MKSAFKMVSAFLVVMLVLVVFPATSAHAACTNAAAFIMDKAPLDNTKLDPGATFSKSWVVQNVGTCTWDSSYELVNIDTGGDPFGGTPATVTTSTVGRYQTITLTVNGMTAPAATGTYTSNWMLSVSGVKFGVGGWGGAGVPIFTKIKVVAPPAVAFYFADKASSATWTSGTTSVTSPVPFGSMPGSIDGSAISGSTFKLEDGTTPAKSILFTADKYPHSAPHYIQAEYPDMYSVKSGDRFQATVGCETSASCWVSFSLQFRYSSGGTVYTLGTFLEKNEGLTRKVDISLNSLAGKNVQFILRGYNYRYPAGDGEAAIWGDPVIVGTGGSVPPSTSGWNTYKDSSVPFTFMFPGSTFTDASSAIILPKGTGVDKTLEDVTTSTASSTPAVCLSTIPDADGSYDAYKSPKGVDFNIEESSSGSDVWIAYTAIKPDPGGGSPTCVSLEFKLSASGTPADLAILKAIADTFEF